LVDKKRGIAPLTLEGERIPLFNQDKWSAPHPDLPPPRGRACQVPSLLGFWRDRTPTQQQHATTQLAHGTIGKWQGTSTVFGCLGIILCEQGMLLVT